MKSWISTVIKTVCFCFVLAACAITPQRVTDSSLKPDTSTPIEYAKIASIFNNGIVGYGFSDGTVSYRFNFPKGKKFGKEISFAILTKNKVENYNSLIERFAIRYKERVGGSKLKVNDGINTYESEYGDLYKIDVSHYKSFLILESYANNNIPVDSGWDKTVESLSEFKDKITGK